MKDNARSVIPFISPNEMISLMNSNASGILPEIAISILKRSEENTVKKLELFS